MPSVPLHLQSSNRNDFFSSNPLPTLLQTPSGLAILEIQGTINTPPLPPKDLSSGLSASTSDAATPIGRLEFPHYSETKAPSEWMKTVYFYVGRHQRLTGEVKKLAKPLAVIRRRAATEAPGYANGGGEELEIVEVVYHKILFSSRPEPVGEV